MFGRFGAFVYRLGGLLRPSRSVLGPVLGPKQSHDKPREAQEHRGKAHEIWQFGARSDHSRAARCNSCNVAATPLARHLQLNVRLAAPIWVRGTFRLVSVVEETS